MLVGSRQPSTEELAEIRAVVATIGKPYVSGSSGRVGYSYLPLPFEELADVPHHRPDAWERWEAISGAIDFTSITLGARRVIDLGCSTGFFCFQAYAAGAYVTGIDYDDKALRVANLIKAAYTLSDDIGFTPADVRGAVLMSTDIVFAMSILHWVRISNGDAGMENFARQIGERCRLAFIELPIWGSGGAGVPWLKAEEEVGGWLRQFFVSVGPLIDVSSHAGRRRTWKCVGHADD